MSYVFGKIHTCVVKTTHMIVQVIIGNSHTCLVFTTHMEVVEISVNFHTCVVFTKQPEWDPSLNNFHSKLLSYFEQFPFLSILISFIFEFFGSLGTKTLLLHKFCFCTEIQFCFTFQVSMLDSKKIPRMIISRSNKCLFKLCVIKSILKLLAREDAKSHWLHLFDFSPLCVFKWVFKLPVREDA